MTMAIPVTGGTTTSATITGMPAGTYYFAVRTVAPDGTSSDPTSLTTKTVP